MTIFKWTMEAVWAAVAVLVTLGGAAYSHVYGAGATNAALQSVAQHQTTQDQRLDAHDTRLNKAETDAAAEQQSLKDIKEQLNRIEGKL